MTTRKKSTGRTPKATASILPARRLYVPRAQQRDLHSALERFNVLVAHRRFRKGALYH